MWSESPEKGVCAASHISASIYTTDPAHAHSLIGCSGHNGHNRPTAPAPPSGTRAYRKVLESWGQFWFKGSDVETL